MPIGIAVFVVLVGLLTGCASGGSYAPVVSPGDSQHPTHVVSQTETLYSIAWRYGFDFRALADANGIVEPYLIYPGQTLLLTTSGAGAAATKPTARPAPQPSATTRATANTPAIQADKAPQKQAAGRDQPMSLRAWQWPVNAPLGSGFSTGKIVHKGIDILGKMGEPVHAANSGRVVYAGSGLVGYGNLVIVKHSENYLSAYGHNSSLHVREGDRVEAGQVIASVGDSGTNRVKLHFEIRRDGKPINPLQLLPRR